MKGKDCSSGGGVAARTRVRWCLSLDQTQCVLVLGVKVGAPPQQVVEDTELEGLRQRVLA